MTHSVDSGACGGRHADTEQQSASASRLSQPLASDPTLRLDELLRLPTLRLGAEQLYERLTILIVAGKITRVFYPVPNPGSHAAEVLDHLTGW